MTGIAMVETEQQSADTDRCMVPDVSVVVPVYNEAENVEPLCHDIREALDPTDLDYEVLLVDDGSRDQTLKKAQEAIKNDAHFKAIELRRNFGKSAALNAGFDLARAEVVVTMDGDLQNDPRDIPALLEKLDEGYDVVSGWRKERQEKAGRKMVSRVANSLISAMTRVSLHDYGCCLKAYRRSVLQDVTLYGEMHRFIPALVRWVGGRVGEMPVNDRARYAGDSKFDSFGRILEVLFDLATVKFLMQYLTKPLYFFGRIALGLLLMALLVLGVLVGLKLAYGADMTGNPLLYMSVLLVILSMQFGSLGLMMELIARTYHESQNRKVYSVREIHEGGGGRVCIRRIVQQ